MSNKVKSGVGQGKREKERAELEMSIATYLLGEQYYDAGGEYCKKCGCLLVDLADLCRHLHSDAHQRVRYFKVLCLLQQSY